MLESVAHLCRFFHRGKSSKQYEQVDILIKQFVGISTKQNAPAIFIAGAHVEFS